MSSVGGGMYHCMVFTSPSSPVETAGLMVLTEFGVALNATFAGCLLVKLHMENKPGREKNPTQPLGIDFSVDSTA